MFDENAVTPVYTVKEILKKILVNITRVCTIIDSCRSSDGVRSQTIIADFDVKR